MTRLMLNDAQRDVRRVLLWLLTWTTLESGLVIAHVQYGANRYENPGLQHVIVVALFWLMAAAIVIGTYVRRPSNAKRWLLTAVVGLPFVGIFGLAHGAAGHGLKLILHASGVAPERLATLVNMGDFVVPDDAFFELTGVGTFFASLLVCAMLWRFCRMTHLSPKTDTTGT